MSYRVGIIGCGGMGHSHAKAWGQRKDTDVVAAMDISPEAAQRLAEEHSVPATYTDYDEMLAKEELDIVSIPTWQGARAAPAIAAAQAGVKAILGEKPMADNLGNADDMIAACDTHSVKLAIGHQRRFAPAANEIRRLVADGAIGEPRIVHHIAKPNAGLLNTATHAIDGCYPARQRSASACHSVKTPAVSPTIAASRATLVRQSTTVPKTSKAA